MSLADAKPFAVAAWNLNEAGGTRADQVGSNDVTDNNTVASAAGQFGDAADFEASNSEYLSVADNAALSFGDEKFCGRVWVKLESLVNGAILGKWTTGTGNREYLLFYNANDHAPNNRFTFSVSSDGTTSTRVDANNLGAPSTGVWYLIHAWHDSANDEIGIAVNAGTPDVVAHTTGVFDGTSDFRLGALVVTATLYHFDGLIDDPVILRGYILDATERTEDYNAGTGVEFANWAGTGIAFDASTDGATITSGSSLTFSHTCGAGSDRILFVGFVGDTTTDDVTGVTYGGVAMTLVAKNTDAATNRFVYLFTLINPASGANNVVISISGSHFLSGGAVSYTGAKQTGQPDASNMNTASGTSLTTSVTTVADNCWTVLVEGGFNNNLPPAAGTGSTRREFDPIRGIWGLFDSGAALTPAGSHSMQTTRTQLSDIGHVMASFAPADAPSAGNRRRRVLIAAG